MADNKNSKEKTKIQHQLVPEHKKLSEEKKTELLEYHKITTKQLPKILITDPAIKHLDVKENDVIEITRHSPTAGKTTFYRGVVSE